MNALADYPVCILNPKGVMVVMKGTHTCMLCRGVETDGEMVTSAVRGVFYTDKSLKEEFLSLIWK